MSVIISVFYPLWYRSYRSRIKEIIETDINAAKTLLDEIIIEHDTISDEDESLRLHHAQRHIIYATGDPIQKDATIRALDED